MHICDYKDSHIQESVDSEYPALSVKKRKQYQKDDGTILRA